MEIIDKAKDGIMAHATTADGLYIAMHAAESAIIGFPCFFALTIVNDGSWHFWRLPHPGNLLTGPCQFQVCLTSATSESEFVLSAALVPNLTFELAEGKSRRFLFDIGCIVSSCAPGKYTAMVKMPRKGNETIPSDTFPLEIILPRPSDLILRQKTLPQFWSDGLRCNWPRLVLESLTPMNIDRSFSDFLREDLSVCSLLHHCLFERDIAALASRLDIRGFERHCAWPELQCWRLEALVLCGENILAGQARAVLLKDSPAMEPEIEAAYSRDGIIAQGRRIFGIENERFRGEKGPYEE
jgi:hypothetical protein